MSNFRSFRVEKETDKVIFLSLNVNDVDKLADECTAVRDNMKIIVLYNSCYVFKDWCPSILRDKGIHVAIKDSYGWNYQKVKNAFDAYE